MRDLIVTALFMGPFFFVFRNAWVGVLLWTWISVMNPHRLTYGFAASAPFAALAAGATLIALFTTRGPVRLPGRPAMYMLLAFIAWMGLTTVFAIFPDESYEQLTKIIKIQLMTLVMLAVLHEERHIHAFVWINVLSLGFFGVKGGIFTITSGGGDRVWGPGGFIGGNNEIGLAMLIVIPLMSYLHRTTSQRWVRRGLVVMMLLTAVAVLGTQSRGAFLALASMSVLLWWRAPGRRLLSGVIFAVLAGGLFTLMPDSWHERMGTIRTYEQDGSAMGRINAWETAVNIAKSRPTGAGYAAYEQSIFAIYAPVEKTDRASDPSIVRAAHSVYFQILGEHGFPGLVLFLLLWLLTFKDSQAIRKATRDKPHLAQAYALASMCQVALLGYLVGGAFLSLAYFDLPYNLMVIVLTLHRWMKLQLARPAPVAQPGDRPTKPRPVANGTSWRTAR